MYKIGSMEECSVCDATALHVCKSCPIILCNDHKITHENSKKGEHIFESIGLQLNSYQISKILENVSLKLKAAYNCKVTVLEETEVLIEKIQSMCTEAIKTIQENQQKYIDILRICNNRLSVEQITEIESDLATSLIVITPTHEFKDIKDFYKLNLLHESEPLSISSLFNLQDSIPKMKEQYRIDYAGHTREVTSVAITPDNNYIVSASNDRTLRLWSILERREEPVLQSGGSIILCVAITSDGNYIANGYGDKSIIIWNLKSKTPEGILRGHTGSVWCVAIAADTKYLVSGSSDKTIRIWNLEDKTQEDILRGHSNTVWSVGITSDSKIIVSGSCDNTVRIWSYQYKEQEAVLIGHSGSVNSVVISGDDKYIVSGSTDKTVRIWSIDDRSIEAVLEGHTDNVRSVAMTSDNQYIVSCGNDKNLIIWNFQQRRQEAVLQGHTDSVCTVAISRDNKHVASGGKDQTVRVWNL